MLDARDTTLIELNLVGLRTENYGGRARMYVQFPGEAERWRLIVPTGQPNSPFDIEQGQLLLNGEPIGVARTAEHDDAKLGYFRKKGRSITLNSNKRSSCTGCAFCPNTGLESSDASPRVVETELKTWIEATLRVHGLTGLDQVEQVNISTGCFGEEDRALDHLERVGRVLRGYDFRGRLGILSSVIRSQEGFDRFAASHVRTAVILTLECLTRREMLLKRTKASLTVDGSLEVLERARTAGVDAGVTLIAGLDPLPVLGGWLEQAADLLSIFPNLQIFQAHGEFMAMFRQPGADAPPFFLEARETAEAALASSGLLPETWSNYRGLWYYAYQGVPLVGAADTVRV